MESGLRRFFTKDFAKSVYDEAIDEDVVSNAAQVAFYFIFALFPLLLFLLSIFGMVLGSAENLRLELFGYLREVIPGAAATLIEQTVEEVVRGSSGSKLTVGFLLALWSASTGIDSLRTVLNDVYDLEEKRAWWKTKLMSVLLTIGIGILTIVTTAAVYGLSSNLNEFIAGALAFLLIIAALLLAFAFLFAFVPDHTPFTWKWITPGAVSGVAMWLIASLGFRVYLHYFDSYAKTYGSLGAIIILLLWLYITALVILLGGVMNHVADDKAK